MTCTVHAANVGHCGQTIVNELHTAIIRVFLKQLRPLMITAKYKAGQLDHSLCWVESCSKDDYYRQWAGIGFSKSQAFGYILTIVSCYVLFYVSFSHVSNTCTYICKNLIFNWIEYSIYENFKQQMSKLDKLNIHQYL